MGKRNRNRNPQGNSMSENDTNEQSTKKEEQAESATTTNSETSVASISGGFDAARFLESLRQQQEATPTVTETKEPESPEESQAETEDASEEVEVEADPDYVRFAKQVLRYTGSDHKRAWQLFCLNFYGMSQYVAYEPDMNLLSTEQKNLLKQQID